MKSHMMENRKKHLHRLRTGKQKDTGIDIGAHMDT